MPYKRFLGYEKGDDGQPQIVESEAEIVRSIYRLFMKGRTPSAIAKLLADNDILSPGGKNTWQVATVESILTNERYKGDALLQKSYTVDFLTKKIKQNEGEVPQYYVQNSHPAIIDPDEFDAVQAEFERRKKLGRPGSCHSPLSTKLVCGDCGGYYGSKVWGSNTKYRKVIWRCNEKYNGANKCSTPHVTEEEVKQKFVESFNLLLDYRDELIANCRVAQSALCDCSAIDHELDELQREIEVVTELARKSISENAHKSLRQDEWNERNKGYLERHSKATKRALELEELKSEKLRKNLVLENFIRDLATSEGILTEFDEHLWLAAVEKVLVMPNGGLTFQFKDGTEINRK